jgi:hypothetical protein
MDIFPMIELILLSAAALSVAVTASVRNKRRFDPVADSEASPIVSPRPTAD